MKGRGGGYFEEISPPKLFKTFENPKVKKIHKLNWKVKGSKKSPKYTTFVILLTQILRRSKTLAGIKFTWKQQMLTDFMTLL